jgi:glutaredoxin
MTSENTPITMFGADWCRDCVRTKKQLDELGVPYTYVDLVADPAAADVAREISGRTNIPVVVYPRRLPPRRADQRRRRGEAARALLI